MAKLSRRSILAGLAASPMLAGSATMFAAPKVTRDNKSTRTLYLYVHGAVIVDLRPDGMVIHAPRVTMSGQLAHAYRIGYGKNGEGDELAPGVPLALLGFAGAAQPPKIDKTQNPYLGTRTLDGTGNFCSLIAPLPARLVSRRQIPKDDSCGDFFPGIADLKDLTWLPTVLRVEFDLQQSETVHLVDGNWKDDGANYPVIHFRAEPGKKEYSDHDAFLAMSLALGMPIQLASGYLMAAAKYKLADDRTLLEVLAGSTGGGIEVPPCPDKAPKRDSAHQEASRPANCVHLVVNNTGIPLT